MVNKPLELSQKEWVELYNHPEVQAGFGIDMKTSLTDFQSSVYAVKFDYISENIPQYKGDLIILMPSVFIKPMILIRNKGYLRVIQPGEV